MKTLKMLHRADAGSFYTIIGAGGDLNDWVRGYEGWLTDEGIGTPVEWFKTTGAAVNNYVMPDNPNDEFPPDLTILLFPLDGLDIGRLAMFKLQYADRWFDDVVANMR